MTQFPEEIIPLVYGREMITYGKKKCVTQVKNTSTLQTMPATTHNLPQIKMAKVGDGKYLFIVDLCL